MVDTVDDVLKEFRRAGKERPQSEFSEKETYAAYSLTTEPVRLLELRFKFPESSDCLSYGNLSSIVAEWRMGMAILLEFDKVLVKIRGEGLTELIQSLKRWQVDWIMEYDPQVHGERVAGAPYVESIVLETRQPVEPVPAHQIH